MLSSEQNPEECDARDDDSSNIAGNIKKIFPAVSSYRFPIHSRVSQHSQV
jgi:hypothetical protein